MFSPTQDQTRTFGHNSRSQAWTSKVAVECYHDSKLKKITRLLSSKFISYRNYCSRVPTWYIWMFGCS